MCLRMSPFGHSSKLEPACEMLSHRLRRAGVAGSRAAFGYRRSFFFGGVRFEPKGHDVDRLRAKFSRAEMLNTSGSHAGPIRQIADTRYAQQRIDTAPAGRCLAQQRF